MLIVFEGVDGAGKTTLAQALSKRTATPYYNSFAGDNSWGRLPGINDYAEDLVVADFSRQTRSHVISDRGFASALIYRRFAGRPSQLTQGDWDHFWLETCPKDTFYIWLRRDLKKCRLERFCLSDLEVLDKYFAKAFEIVPCGKAEVWNNGHPDEALDIIIERMEEWENKR